MSESSKEEHPDVKKIFKDAIRASYSSREGNEDLSRAAEILREGIKRFPHSYMLNQQLFFTLCQQGKPDEGIAMMEKYSGLYPDDITIQVLLLGKYVVLEDPKYYGRARRLVKNLADKPMSVEDKGYFGAYVKHLKEADEDIILAEAMNLSFPKGGVEANFVGAEAIIREGIEAYPDSYSLYEHLYMVMRANGQGAEGILELEKFAGEYPEDFDAQELLLNMYVGARCYQNKARALLEKLATWQLDEGDRRHLLVHADCMGYDGDCLGGENHIEIEPK